MNVKQLNNNIPLLYTTDGILLRMCSKTWEDIRFVTQNFAQPQNFVNYI